MVLLCYNQCVYGGNTSVKNDVLSYFSYVDQQVIMRLVLFCRRQNTAKPRQHKKT